MYYNSSYLNQGKSLENVVSDLETALSYLNDVGQNFNKAPYELCQAIGKVQDFLGDIEAEIEEDKLQSTYEQ